MFPSDRSDHSDHPEKSAALISVPQRGVSFISSHISPRRMLPSDSGTMIQAERGESR